MKEFVSPALVIMETGKVTFSVTIVTVAKGKNAPIKTWILYAKNWVDWISTREKNVNIKVNLENEAHMLKKTTFSIRLQIIKKYNFFTLESYSKAPGLNFHTLSIYLIDLIEAHLEVPKPGTLFWKPKNPTQHI